MNIAKKGDMVSVEYTGKLEDGKKLIFKVKLIKIGF